MSLLLLLCNIIKKHNIGNRTLNFMGTSQTATVSAQPSRLQRLYNIYIYCALHTNLLPTFLERMSVNSASGNYADDRAVTPSFNPPPLSTTLTHVTASPPRPMATTTHDTHPRPTTTMACPETRNHATSASGTTGQRSSTNSVTTWQPTANDDISRCSSSSPPMVRTVCPPSPLLC